jgi:enoyl-CoA hydratase/carnithine racemase
MLAAKRESKPMYIDDENPGELLTEQFFTGRVLQIHRPTAANALSESLASKVARAVQGMDLGAVTSFFVLRGSGVDNLKSKLVVTERDKFFCSGSDLLALQQAWEDGQRDKVFDYYKAEAQMISSMVNCRKPWAVGMDGTTMGVGAGMAMHSVFRFASEMTVWAIPETAYGSVPGYGSSFQLPNLPHELGTFLALTGRRLVGHDLVWAGLASNMIDPALYGDLCLAVSHQNSSEMQYVVRTVSMFDSQRPIEEEPFVLEPHLETIASCFRYDSIEQIREKLTEVGSPFARQTLAKLDEKSPASLKLTLRLLRQGRERDDVMDAIQTEHAVLTRLWKDVDSDLHTGLKQVVFGGGKKKMVWPKQKVDDSYVERMFAPSTSAEEVLALPPLAPRPPTEALQLLEWSEDLVNLAGAPDLDLNEEARVGNNVVPDMKNVGVVGPEELVQKVQRSMDKIIIPATYWYVEKPGSASAEETMARTVQNTEFGDVFFARDAKTNEVVPLPEDVKQELLEQHPNLRELNIFKVESYAVDPSVDVTNESELESLHAALREEAGVAEPTEADAASKPNRIVTSESLEETFARPFLSADEEAEAYLKLAGHVERTPDETDIDAVHNFDDFVPQPDKRPLSKREQLI